MPHLPQFFESALKLVHPPVAPQQVSPPHVLSQPPQLFWSVFVFTQTPLQRVKGGGQTQLLFVHTWPPVQMFPHFPQFCESLVKFTQAFPHLV